MSIPLSKHTNTYQCFNYFFIPTILLPLFAIPNTLLKTLHLNSNKMTNPNSSSSYLSDTSYFILWLEINCKLTSIIIRYAHLETSKVILFSYWTDILKDIAILINNNSMLTSNIKYELFQTVKKKKR